MKGKLTAAFKDNGVNRVLKRIMSQRPHLFNHVAPSRTPILDEAGQPTGDFKDLFLVCRPVHLGKNAGSAPRYTVRPPMKLGSFVALPYCLQVTDIDVDFHPGDQIALPKELSPLNEQNFSMRVESCFGLACATKKAVDELVRDAKPDPPGPVTVPVVRGTPVLQVTRLDCFCFSLLFVGKVVVKKSAKGVDYISIEMLGTEIVDIQPEGLEAIAECNVRLLLEYFVLPFVVLPLKEITFNILTTAVKLTPWLTPDLPFNPAVEDDQLKVSIDWEVTSD
jgi:hypothetical protein